MTDADDRATRVIARAMARHRAGVWWPRYTEARQRTLVRGATIPAAALWRELQRLEEDQ